MDRIRVYTGGVASCNGYLFKTKDNSYVAVDAPSGFADWIYSKKPDIIITTIYRARHFRSHVETPAACARSSAAAFTPDSLTLKT